MHGGFCFFNGIIDYMGCLSICHCWPHSFGSDPDNFILPRHMLHCSSCWPGPYGTQGLWYGTRQVLHTSGSVSYIRCSTNWLLAPTSTLTLTLLTPHQRVWHPRRCLFLRLSMGRSGPALAWFCWPWPWPSRAGPTTLGPGPPIWGPGRVRADPGPHYI